MLMQAKRLHGKASYLILEARPRAGGRGDISYSMLHVKNACIFLLAYTASLFEDKVEVDLGASFIHGEFDVPYFH